ncbi:MAG: hypothetical protein EON57_11740 [Alphaproteobacteria bacterium]|nr:MAG: hypothetical protein EON57_11740 [Alphaproteobacteria bacterium]
MRNLLLTAALLATAVGPVAAQDMMPKSTAPWTVVDLGASCIAINRPPAEFNAAPYNAMAFHQLKTDELPRIQAFFWPGALTEGAEVKLQVTPAGQSTVELAAKAVTGFQLVTVDPAPAALLDALAIVPSVQVSAQGVTELMLFETSAVEAVAEKMRDCVKKPA